MLVIRFMHSLPSPPPPALTLAPPFPRKTHHTFAAVRSCPWTTLSTFIIVGHILQYFEIFCMRNLSFLIFTWAYVSFVICPQTYWPIARSKVGKEGTTLALFLQLDHLNGRGRILKIIFLALFGHYNYINNYMSNCCYQYHWPSNISAFHDFSSLQPREPRWNHPPHSWPPLPLHTLAGVVCTGPFLYLSLWLEEPRHCPVQFCSCYSRGVRNKGPGSV